MKILFVASHLPYPLHSGGQVRVYNLLSRLGKKHEVTLFAFLRSETEKEYIKELSFCRKIDTVYRGHAWQPHYVTKSLLSTYPLLFATYAKDEMRAKITKELSNSRYDLVHIEPSYVWPALPTVDLPVVVGEHNIEYSGYRGYVDSFSFVPLRPFLMFDVVKLKWWEQKVWKKAARVVAVSDEDRRIITKTAGSKVDVVPNGVDLRQFPFKPKKPTLSPVFLFVGYFGWLQNRDAVRFLAGDIWPLLKERYPNAELRIVGRQAPTELVSFIRAKGILLLEGVSDIAHEYQKADILLAPIRLGSGSRYKILEAMASGLPVVTTSVGAGGLHVFHKKEVMVGDNPKDFVGAVGELLTNDTLRSAIVNAARKRIEASYSWEIISRDLEKVWEKSCRK